MALRALARHPLVTVDRTTTIAEVARIMDESDAHLVVVTEGKRMVGVVTERDIVVRGVARRYPADARIEAVMSTDVSSLPADTDRQDALAAFRDHGVRHLPLVDGTTVIAVLADDDLVDGTGEAAAGIGALAGRTAHRPA
jgi:CBS domain-containing protein